MTTEEQLKAIADKYGVNAQKPIQSGGLDSLRQKLNQTTQVQQEPTVTQSVSSDLQQRGQNIADITKARIGGQSVTGEVLNAVAPNSLEKVKSVVSTAQKIRERLGMGNQVATGGQVAGGINDVLGEAIGAIIPEKWKQFGADKVKQLLGTAGIDTIEKYNQWATQNPLTAKNIEGAVNIASLLPTGKAAEVTGKAGIEVVQSGAEQIAKGTGELVQSGAKLAGDVLPNKQGMISGQISKALDLTQGDVSNIKLLTGNDVGDFIARNNIIGANKKETLDLVKQITDNQYKAVRDEIAKVPTVYKPSQMPRLKESLNLLENQVKGVPGMESTYKEVKSLLKKKDYLLSDAQRVKELLDNQFSLYSAIGDVKEGTIKKGLANVRKDVKQFIEKEVKNATGADIGTLNNDVSTGKSILKLAEKRSTRDLTRANVSLSDLGTFGTGSVLGTPLGGAAALFVKRVIETPTFRLKFAKLLNSLSSTEKTVIKNELLKGEVPEILKKEVTQSLKPSASNIKKINKTSIPTVSRKNGIMSSDLSTGVKKAYNNAKDTLKTLKDKNVRERGSVPIESLVPDLSSKGNQGVSLTKNTTEDLIQQAKKYKSAEEFVRAQSSASEVLNNWDGLFTGKNPGIVKAFHGTTKESANLINQEGFKIMPKQRFGRYTGDGIYFSPEKGGTARYSGGGKELDAFIDISNYKTVYLPEGNIDWQPGVDLVREWKQKYDGVILRLKDTDTITKKVESDWVNEIVAYNPKTVKTKSQLEEIWKKANKK